MAYRIEVGSRASAQLSELDRTVGSAVEHTALAKTAALLQDHMFWATMLLMTRDQVQSAVASGRRFALRMADGREYSVPHHDYISLPPRGSYVIVYDDNGHFTVLPLLTMTGLQSNVA
jgi:hypothetical protein